MQFAFWLGNHNKLGQRSLEDVIGIAGHQLRALGHRAVWDQSNAKVLRGGDGINVVVEGFTRGEGGSIEKLAETYNQGARWLCLATEEPTPKGFNWGRQQEMVFRQETFRDAAKFFEGILHLVPGQHVTDWYGQYAPTAYAELGYAPTLVRPGNLREPEFDFGFYGSLSPRRLRILKRLARRIGTEKAIRVVADFSSQEDRDRDMRNAKVICQVRKYDEMGLVSSSRCNTALCLGRPVVAEAHELSKPWDEIVKFTPPLTEEEREAALSNPRFVGMTDRQKLFEVEVERFCRLALSVRAAWRAVQEDQFCKFKDKLSPEICFGEPLRKIGVLERRQAA